MIIEGCARSNPSGLAIHLLKPENDRVVVVEITGTATQDLHEALQDMHDASLMTKGKHSLYHAKINPKPGETMTAGQWHNSVETLEQNMGFQGQPRAVVYHEKKGRPHLHVVWQRTDTNTGTMRPYGNDRYIHQKTGRTLEKEFGHELTNRKFVDRSGKGYSLADTQMTNRDGRTPPELKREMSKIWQESKSIKSFQSVIAEQGFQLAMGRRGVVMVSQSGKVYSLARYTGQKKQTIDRRFEGHMKSLPQVKTIKSQISLFPNPRIAKLKGELANIKVDSLPMKEECAYAKGQVEYAWNNLRPEMAMQVQARYRALIEKHSKINDSRVKKSQSLQQELGDEIKKTYDNNVDKFRNHRRRQDRDRER